MIKIEHIEVVGFAHAIRGMRNAKNSHDQSDSYYTTVTDCEMPLTVNHEYFIGPNDLKLMKSLATAGQDHGKFMRHINVYCDITAPFYWLKQMDTYRVGVEKNSCSTMHKIHAKEFTEDDFSYDHLDPYDDDIGFGDICTVYPKLWLHQIVRWLNYAREKFLETGDRKFWWWMIQLLPSSYNQRRTYMISYAALRAMYHARKNHKLDEWRSFCDWIRTLPYSELITGEDSES